MSKFPLIRHLPTNLLGKDYVIGDLHGCLDYLLALLEFVDFDKSKDRLFSVGDLVDRGPDSLRCLELVDEPWFYGVLGNHELMMLEFFLPYLSEGKLCDLEDVNETGYLDYGGDWVKQYFQPENQTMSEEFNQGLIQALALPQMLVIGEGDNRFHVVHAELDRPEVVGKESLVWLDKDIDSWLADGSIDSEILHRMNWGRKLMHSKFIDNPEYKVQLGLSRTFCGHTTGPKPRQTLSHICIDTGAYINQDKFHPFSGRHSLTLFDVKESRYFCRANKQPIVCFDFV